MIKIETMSEDCIATVNDNRIFVGQLFTYTDIQTLKVTAGKVMYTVDELEIKEVEAPAKVVKPAKVIKPVAVPAAA